MIRQSMARMWIGQMLALMLAAPAMAQEASLPDLITDRPDYTESSEVVGRGLLQLESGFTFEGDGAGPGRSRSLAVPASLLRLGLTSRSELRLSTAGFLSQHVGGARTSGMGDIELGAKVKLANQSALGIDLALIPMASFPTGSTTETSGHVDPTLKVTWARTAGSLGISGNVNLSSVSDDRGRLTQKDFSLSLGHPLAGAWSGFIETYAFTPMGLGEGAGATIDGGVTRLIGSNLQIDVEGGRGVTAAAPNWFVAFGFAIRTQIAGTDR